MNETPNLILSSVVSITKGKKHSVVEIPSTNAKRIIGIDDLRNDDLIRYTSDTQGTEAVFEDVLIAWDGANAGTIGFGKAGFIGSTIARLRLKDKGKFYTPFLGAFLQSKFEYLKQTATGATIPHINRNALEQLALPNIEFDDQIRIAHLLGNVESLIARRKQHLKQLDDLLKSVFLEMFGDPMGNERGWDVQPCDKVVLDISSGTSYSGEERPFANAEEVGVLKISAVTKGIFDPKEFKVVNRAQIMKTLRFVRRGDFLFSRANTVELVAACCIVPQDYERLFLPDKLWVLTLNNQLINSPFLNHLLKNERYRDTIRALASGGHDSMLNISMKKFMTLAIICPPIDLQNQFAAIVEKVEGIKSRYQQSLTDLENLYGALSQKAFKGELDLSRVPLPVESTTEDTESTEGLNREIREQRERELEFNLPDPIEDWIITEENRHTQIGVWFDAYLDQLVAGESPFIDVFFELLEKKFYEFEGEYAATSVTEYDQVKEWLFMAIADGRIEQTRNTIQLDNKDALGNQVVLKKV